MRRVASTAAFCFVAFLICGRSPSTASPPPDAALFLDLGEDDNSPVRLHHGAKRVRGEFGDALAFTDALQYAEVGFSGRLHGSESATVGGWFFPKRAGEQSFLSRGVPLAGDNGERMFPPR